MRVVVITNAIFPEIKQSPINIGIIWYITITIIIRRYTGSCLPSHCEPFKVYNY